ncbi:hypothetical protein [Xanthobacter aminoxidans]|uniref:hypothetical protein n=1 Tax=Xanthobacter aminoxidans TaxID=186280 RepID=UPI002022CBCC|nr:hypothetical protein [Xanthobacter aminoxidans]MCL8382089.1 hypothetical protein [Xanthobacter aminoxidans]
MSSRDRIVVADHAVLRWIERVAGVDIDALRQQIANEARSGIDLGARRIVQGGMVYALDPVGRRVVNCFTVKEMRDERWRPRRSPRDFREDQE